jgi:hypothetical protein
LSLLAPAATTNILGPGENAIDGMREGMIVRQSIVAMALAGALLSGWACSVAAQDGIVIQNNGVDSSQSAAGADNVNVSLAPGNSSSVNGPGTNNEAGSVVKDKDRVRKDRSERNNSEELAAPVEEAPAAPAEGYEAYTEGGEWVDPAAVPQEAVAEPVDDSNAPIQLPNTGVGVNDSAPLSAAALAIAASALGAAGVRRRQLR